MNSYWIKDDAVIIDGERYERCSDGLFRWHGEEDCASYTEEEVERKISTGSWY